MLASATRVKRQARPRFKRAGYLPARPKNAPGSPIFIIPVDTPRVGYYKKGYLIRVTFMGDDISKRNEKGQFEKGVSGNPSGKTKDGLIPQQDHPLQDARDLVKFIRNKRSEADKIFIENAPDLMQKAIDMALNGDSRVMAQLMPVLIPDLDKYDPSKPSKPRTKKEIMNDLKELMGQGNMFDSDKEE